MSFQAQFQPSTDAQARRLATETGITDAQARELIKFLGLDWPSLVREARLLGAQDSFEGLGQSSRQIG